MLQMEHPESLIHTLPDLFLRDAVIFQSERHLAGTVDRKKLTARILKNRCRQFTDLADAQISVLLAGEPAEPFPLALIKLRDQPVDAAQQRRFPAAAAPAKHHAAALRHLAADLLQRGALFLRILKSQFKLYHDRSVSPFPFSFFICGISVSVFRRARSQIPSAHTSPCLKVSTV